jgi:decaprenyl-phosphate phosphoribosyltransferase
MKILSTKLKAILSLIRVKHWIKNFFVFIALVFSLNLFNIDMGIKTIIAFFSFCFASSFIYIINDMKDVENDRMHPEKKKRPLVNKTIGINEAIILLVFMLIGALSLSLLLNYYVFAIVVAYIVLNILYTWGSKHIVLLDVFFIAVGFVLRVMVGAAAIEVEVTNWLLLTSLFISLFLGFGKRRSEIVLLESKKNDHRPVLEDYSIKLLDSLITSTATLTILCYALYTIDKESIIRLGTNKLIFTVIFVVYGMYKYMHILFNENGGGDPVEVVSKDPSIIINVLLWIACVVLFIYVGI